MHQVQLLFANLQHSNAACYDPEELTKGLNIDVGVQQDAQEFNKLILTFLEDQLQHSPDQSLHGLVQKHFRGEFCYSTICQSCKQPSQSSHNKYPFYELELNLKPTLAESLADYVQSDYLEGDNQYLCENCNGKRDATRQIALRELTSRPDLAAAPLCLRPCDVRQEEGHVKHHLPGGPGHVAVCEQRRRRGRLERWWRHEVPADGCPDAYWTVGTRGALHGADHGAASPARLAMAMALLRTVTTTAVGRALLMTRAGGRSMTRRSP